MHLSGRVPVLYPRQSGFALQAFLARLFVAAPVLGKRLWGIISVLERSELGGAGRRKRQPPWMPRGSRWRTAHRRLSQVAHAWLSYARGCVRLESSGLYCGVLSLISSWYLSRSLHGSRTRDVCCVIRSTVERAGKQDLARLAAQGGRQMYLLMP